MVVMVEVVVVVMVVMVEVVVVVVVLILVLVKMTSKDDQPYHLIVNHTLLCIGVLDRWVVVSHKVALKENAISESFFAMTVQWWRE